MLSRSFFINFCQGPFPKIAGKALSWGSRPPPWKTTKSQNFRFPYEYGQGPLKNQKATQLAHYQPIFKWRFAGWPMMTHI